MKIEKIILKKYYFFYLTILKFSLGIIFSIVFFGEGKSTLFNKKTIPEKINTTITNLIDRLIILKLDDLVFFCNCI